MPESAALVILQSAVQNSYKSNTNKKVAGVCGGIGEYLGIDPTIVRLGFVALSLLAGGGLAVYIIAAIIMPEREARHTAAENTVNTLEYEKV